VSSIEPNSCCDEVYGSKEVPPCFVVACCNGTELFDFGKEILDQMARFVDIPIVTAQFAPVGFGRDHRDPANLGKWREDACVGVECLVGDQRAGLHCGQEVVGSDEIMGLAAGQEEADRVTERIDQGVDLGAQSTARTPDRLVLAGFFLAPALC